MRPFLCPQWPAKEAQVTLLPQSLCHHLGNKAIVMTLVASLGIGKIKLMTRTTPASLNALGARIGSDSPN